MSPPLHRGSRVFACLAALLLPLAGARAETHYVSPLGLSHPPYTNWADAATNIQDAVNVATNGDTVLVTNGVWYVSSQIVVSQSVLVASVNGATGTVVDGCRAAPCFLLEQNVGCALRGFTITNGNASGVLMASGNFLMDCIVVACTGGVGGGVFAFQSTVSNCTFLGNMAERVGGGLYSEDSSVIGCTFKDNSAAMIGGGLFQIWSNTPPGLYDSVFVSNSAWYGGGAFCGALTNLEATTNLIFSAALVTNVLDRLACLTNVLLQLPDDMCSAMSPGADGMDETGKGDDFREMAAFVDVTQADSAGKRTVEAATVAVEMPSFVVSNGLFAGNTAWSGGGLCMAGEGEIRDSRFVQNQASSHGGGVVVLEAGALRHCGFVSNHAEIAGGGAALVTVLATAPVAGTVGIATDDAISMRVDDSEFFGNSASRLGGGMVLIGGGYAQDNSFVGNGAEWGGGLGNLFGEVRDCLVVSNAACFGGGCLTMEGAVVGCVVQHNEAEWMGGGTIVGGGMLEECLLSGNAALAGGGVGFLGFVMDAQAVACRITDNKAERVGGGAMLMGGGNLSSCIVSGNRALAGGGAYVWRGGRLSNNTIAGNTASNMAGGVCVVTNTPFVSSSVSNVTVRNTVVYDNIAACDQNVLNLCSNVTYSYCCTLPLAETGGVGNITNDPALTPDYRLRSASPCIDAGTAEGAPPMDIDGEGRWDDPRHSNLVSSVDIGADEFVDADLDSMADCWETNWFGGIASRDGTGDADGDALSDLAEYEHGASPTNSDTDADRMPDGWEVSHALDALRDDAEGDPDADGMRNAGEYMSDTDPRDSASLLTFLRVGRQWGGTRLDWKGGRDAWQVLEVCDHLNADSEAWVEKFAIPPPTPPTNAIIHLGATNRSLFYRIRAVR